MHIELRALPGTPHKRQWQLFANFVAVGTISQFRSDAVQHMFVTELSNGDRRAFATIDEAQEFLLT